MKYFYCISAFLLALSFSPIKVKSLNNDRLAGVYAGGNYNLFDDNFAEPFDICLCYRPKLEGLGTNIETLMEFTLSPGLKADFRFGYFSLFGEGEDNSLVPIKIKEYYYTARQRHSAEFDLKAFRFFPSLKLNIFNDCWLHFGAGVSYLYFGKYSTTDRFVGDKGEIIPIYDGTPVRTTSNGFTDQLNSLYWALASGLSYDINVGGSFILSPEVKYSIALNSVLKDIDYSINTLQFGVAFKFFTF